MRQQAQAWLRDILRQKEVDTVSLEIEKMRELLGDPRTGKFKLVVR